jgi:hypothetical protein
MADAVEDLINASKRKGHVTEQILKKFMLAEGSKKGPTLVKIGRYVSYRNGTERTDMELHYYGTVPYCYGTFKFNGTATLNGTAYCYGTYRT